MIVLKGSQARILEVLESLSGIVQRRHTLPLLANVLLRKSGNTISDGFPESGGGGASAAITVIGTEADAAGSDAPGAGSEVAASDDDDDGESDGDPDRQSSHKQSPPKSSLSGKHRNATATVGALPPPQNPDIALWRLPTVLAHVPVSRSHWWAGVASGRYPAPVKLSTRCVAWRSADIRKLIASF